MMQSGKSSFPALTPSLTTSRAAQIASARAASREGMSLPSIISLVVSLSTGETIEAAMIGRDGAVGIFRRVGWQRLAKPGGGSDIRRGPGLPCTCFQARGLQSESLLSRLISHEQTVYAQAQQTAACMASHEVNSRLARWLAACTGFGGQR